MTDEFLPEALADATTSTKLVYRALASAEAPLSRRRIKIQARCSGRSVGRALNQLADADLLVRQPADTDAYQWVYDVTD